MGFREPVPGLRGHDGLPVLALPPDTILQRGYRVRFLALGGMSLCYKAERDGRQFFLKEVPSQNGRDVMALNQEKGLLERLDHPAIVKVHQLFQEDGFYYLVLDFIVGQSLDRLVSPFPDTFLQDQVILDWGRQLCDVLGYLHRQEPVVIYRDLKPRNILKDTGGRLHLVDFGIARLFKAGQAKDTEALGSALTASPEHYAGQTDVRSDVYSLGATLHFLATNGRGERESPFEFVSPRVANPRLSPALEQVLMKALEVDPARRYQTMEALDEALAACQGSPVAAPRREDPGPPMADPEPEPARPTPPWMWSLMGGLATAVVLGVAWLAGAPRPEVARTQSPPPTRTSPSPLVTRTPVVVPPAETPSPLVTRTPVVPPPPVATRTVAPPPAPVATRTVYLPAPAPPPPPPPAAPPPPPPPVVNETLRDWLGDARRGDLRDLHPVSGRVEGDGFAVELPSGYLTNSQPGADSMLFLRRRPRQPSSLRLVHCRKVGAYDLEQVAESHLELARKARGSDLSQDQQGGEVRLAFRFELDQPGRAYQVQGRERLLESEGQVYSVLVLATVSGYPENEEELNGILESFQTAR